MIAHFLVFFKNFCAHKRFPFFVVVSIVNCFIGYVLADPFIFLIREGFLVVVFSILILFDTELTIFTEENKHINSLLYEKFPLVKLEFPLSIAMIAAVYTSCQSFSPAWQFLYFWCSLISFAYFLIVNYRLYAILKTPELRVYFDPRKTGGVRRLTTASSFARICIECMKYGSSLVGAGFAASYVVPKAFMGANYRSPVVDWAGYQVTGLKSRNEIVYSAAVELVHEFPELKGEIVDSDKATVSVPKLVDQLQKKGRSLYLLKVKND